VEKLIEHRIDSLILNPTEHSNKTLDLLENHKVPYLTIGRKIPNKNKLCVHCDNEAAIYKATEHLIKNGHSTECCPVFEHVFCVT
jgi:LacI family transcriptional regulator